MEQTNQPGANPDEMIRQNIIDSLSKESRIDSSKFQVVVNNGKAILNGKADTEEEKKLSEKIAASVNGVTGVENHLQVEIGIIHALSSLAAHIQGDIIKDNDKEPEK